MSLQKKVRTVLGAASMASLVAGMAAFAPTKVFVGFVATVSMVAVVAVVHPHERPFGYNRRKEVPPRCGNSRGRGARPIWRSRPMTDFNASQATCIDGALEDLRVQVLRTQPGDIVVLSFPDALSPERAARISEAWKSICPHTDVRCVVFDQGGHVDAVLRADGLDGAC